MNNIGETPLTWTQLEEDFSKSYGISLKTGPKRQVDRIGKGKGFLAKIYRIEFDWLLERREGLIDIPKTCALKASTLDVVRELFDNVGSGDKKHLAEYYAESLSNNELFFYENIQKLGLVRVKIPKYFSGRPFGKDIRMGYLAMEFIENSIVYHIYDNFSRDQILEVLDQMAILSGSVISKTQQLKKFIDSEFFDRFLTDFNTKEKTAKGILNCIKKFPSCQEKLEKLLPVAEVFEDPQGIIAISKDNHDSEGEFDLLCQGDLWPPNVLWNEDQEKPKLKAILDWQQVHLGNPLEDLVKWLSLTIEPKDYHQSIDDYLHFYYKKLKAYSNGTKIPWESFKELKKQYEIMYVWQTALYCPIVANTGDLILEGIEEPKKSRLREVYHHKFHRMIDESVELLEKWKTDILTLH